MSFDYDLFVIGAGSGGVRAARMSAALGAKVAVAEERYLGGTCVNVGCVPKKLFVYGSHFAEDFEDSAAYGWSVTGAHFDWPTLRDNKTNEIKRLNEIYRTLLEGPGADIIESRATLTGPHAIEIDGSTITAEKILVATGSWPSVPDFPGREFVITSNEAFFLESFPERVVVVGGGYIAVEFAGIFAGLGAQTTQLYRGPLFLRGFDAGIREFIAAELREKHIDLRFDTHVASVRENASGYVVTLEDGETIDADLVMYATGRTPNSRNLGLEAAGVETAESGGIGVNAAYQTNVDHIYAIGDGSGEFWILCRELN